MSKLEIDVFKNDNLNCFLCRDTPRFLVEIGKEYILCECCILEAHKAICLAENENEHTKTN
jgi:hypothetical protein